MSRRRLAVAALPFVLALALSGCGGGSTTTASTSGDAGSGGGASPSGPTTGAPSATGGPSPSAPTAAPSGDVLEITRSGGIAGVRDVVRVSSDGTAMLVTRDGRTRNCQPPADDVRRLRQMDLTAMSAMPSGSAIADGFMFSVRTPHGSAVVGDGDNSGRRAELLDAAATVLTTCLAGTPTAGGGTR